MSSAPTKATLGTVVGAKKQRVEGYEDGKEMLHTRLSAKAFIDADTEQVGKRSVLMVQTYVFVQAALDMLAAGYEMQLDDPELEANASSELRECMKDLKVMTVYVLYSSTFLCRFSANAQYASC